MATSSITKNFVIKEKSVAEKLVDMMFSATEKQSPEKNAPYSSMMSKEQLKDLFRTYRVEK